MATTETPRLEIHLFGAAKGESVVLRLPSGDWGVVDCYASSLRDSSRNPTLRFLKEQGVDQLEFLCLTHPHDDHYRGMSHLVEEFQIKYFWRPAAMSGRRLKWIIKAARMDAIRSGVGEFAEDADELHRIFHLIKEKNRSTEQLAIPRQSTTGTQLFPVPFDSTAELQIWALAPSTRQVERYERALADCFDQNDHLVSRAAQSCHNLISMALLVVFGQTRIVLGG